MTVEEFAAEWASDSTHVTAHTSGSTGTPKQISLLKADMLVSARATNQVFNITGSSLLVSPLSVDYIAGKMMWVRAQVAGCEALFLPPSSQPLADWRPDRNIDLLPIVPMQADYLASWPDLAPIVRNLIVGGGALSAARRQALLASGYTNVYATYGMTETCSHVALASITDADSPLTFQAMPGVAFDVDASDCLTIISDRYSWRRLQTRDVVRLIDKTHFQWQGRADGVINTGGIKVFPEELETKINAKLSIETPFYILGVDDERLGQRIELRIQRVDGVADDELVSLFATACSKALSRYMVPKRIVVVERVPMTKTGKIRRININ